MRNRKFNTIRVASVLVPAMTLYSSCAENKNNLPIDPEKKQRRKIQYHIPYYGPGKLYENISSGKQLSGKGEAEKNGNFL